jgi:predicted sulfurtransferase
MKIRSSPMRNFALTLLALSIIMFSKTMAFITARNAAKHNNPRMFSFCLTTTMTTTTRLWDATPQRSLSNQELADRRLAVNRAKREARERTVQERVNKNLRIKRLLHTSTTSNSNTSTSEEYLVPELYAVKVWVDEALREDLRLTGREKRGRVFLEEESDGVSTFSGLQQEMYGFFRALRKNTFLMSASLPAVDEEGNLVSRDSPQETWAIASDEDVLQTFQKADEFFANKPASAQLKRPSIQINVSKDPNAPLPPPPPAYLENMADPSESESMTMLSFYAFPAPSGVDDPEAFAFALKKKWKPFQALGRVYIAKEGVNAQMSVPTNVLENFMECCRSVPELGEYMENDINIDPVPLSLEEFAVAGVPINGKPAPPFRNLHVRVRTQIVADGLDKSLDWQSAGYDMPPMEWHQKLKKAKEARQKEGDESTGEDDAEAPILLDCRNTYETDVGIFDGAEPLSTENFRESWDVLKERLEDTPKDAPIMTYCTGGKIHSSLVASNKNKSETIGFRTQTHTIYFFRRNNRNSLCQSRSLFDARTWLHQRLAFGRWYHCLRSYTQRKGGRRGVHVQGYKLCL